MGNKMYRHKLTYYNMKGRAELIRWLLVLSHEPFEDIRVDKEHLPNVLASAPCGKLPIFEFNYDGKNYKTSETMAVGNFLKFLD